MVQSFIIHLERSTDRKPIVDALISTLPNAATISAVDGRALSDQERAKFMRAAPLQPAYPFDLMPSEIGCFLSHRKAWVEIANGPDEFGVIAEDDVVPADGFSGVFNYALRHANSDSLIRFPMKDREVAQHTIEQTDAVHIFRPIEIGLTAALYILGKSAAKRLVGQSEQFDRPVDTWLQMRWETGVDSLTLWPSLISSGAEAHGGSTIQKKGGVWNEVKRTFARAKYRAAITKKSKTS